jgi:hypothetical protein
VSVEGGGGRGSEALRGGDTEDGYAHGLGGALVEVPRGAEKPELGVIKATDDAAYAEVFHTAHVGVEVAADAAAALHGALEPN